ncbi:MAG: hypothetical protein KUG79_10910 [Pseudomonadales bacterium]|nr:hypothetical protein [Pseudomonadales bacterium]
MRSRYSAFCLLNSDYLLHTWHPDTRPRTIQIDHSQQWTGLKVLHCEAGGINDEAGSVEFIARYKLAGKGYRLHETSRFVKLAAQWLYLDGQILEQ